MFHRSSEKGIIFFPDNDLIGTDETSADDNFDECMAAYRPVDAAVGSIAVDSLAPQRVGELTFLIIVQHAAESVLVSDDSIRHAQEMLWDRLRVVAEPGGCAALAALVSGQYRPAPGETVAVVISGANTTAVSFG